MNELDRIFNEDPLNMTKEDIDAIIRYMREQRNAFNVGIKLTPAKPVDEASANLLKDLGL